ncbi:jg25288, partial [Pararge aegeria aegeria]
MDFYMKNFYYNTLTRGSPFFVGMIVGYVIYIYKGQEIKLNKYFVLISWTIALGLIAVCFYTSYLDRQPARGKQDWIRQRTSVMRVIWSIGLG